MRKGFFSFLSIMIVIVIMVTAGGCAKTTPEPTSSTTNTVQTSAGTTATTSVETTPTKKITIAGIVFQEDMYMKMLQLGMKDGAKKNGVEILLSNSGGKLDKEVELVNTYIANGVDGISICVLSPDGSVPALQAAADKGIKVVAAGIMLKSDLCVTQIQNNNVELGQTTGLACKEFIEKNLGGKAKIGIIGLKSGFPEYHDMRYTQGFYSIIKDMPGVEIVAEQDAWLPDTAVQKATDILTANPDIDILWAANEGGTVGCTMAVKNAGKQGKVFVFGTDASEQIANMILSDDNILQASTGQQPYEVGMQSIDALCKALRGETVDEEIEIKGIPLNRQYPDVVNSFLEMVKTLGS